MFPSLPPSYIVTWRRVLLRHGVALETEVRSSPSQNIKRVPPGLRSSSPSDWPSSQRFWHCIAGRYCSGHLGRLVILPDSFICIVQVEGKVWYTFRLFSCTYVNILFLWYSCKKKTEDVTLTSTLYNIWIAAEGEGCNLVSHLTFIKIGCFII